MEDLKFTKDAIHLQQKDQNRPYLPARQDCHLGKTRFYEL